MRWSACAWAAARLVASVMLLRMMDRRAKGNRSATARATPRAAAHPDGIGAAVALLGPGIASHVIPVLLPEPGIVLLQELEPTQPFRALPEVEVRHQKAHRPAVLRREQRAVVRQR